jgi:hypothetical protein
MKYTTEQLKKLYKKPKKVAQKPIYKKKKT